MSDKLLPSRGLAPITLPTHYPSLSREERVIVRSRYAKAQQGLCYACDEPLTGPASDLAREHRVNWALFPVGFEDHPIHLHHDHKTGMTHGAVHAVCNAVLWQFFGE